MANPSLRIWCNMSFPPAASRRLREGTAGHELILSSSPTASNLVAGKPDPQLLEADVAFGQPDPVVLLDAPKLRWAHLTSAGYERYDRDDLRAALRSRGTALTNSSGVYDEPCAEHVLAMMLSLARRLPTALDRQRADQTWPAAEIRAASRLLVGQSALLLGYGAIGRRLVELLTPFRMKLSAVRRNAKAEASIATYGESEMDRLLAEADHVVNLLPGGAGTVNFMTAERFGKMKAEAIYYSVGRGGTTDQDGLLEALRGKRIGAAYLDVTTPEPLPADHALWTTPNCFITPHTAGGHHDEHERIVGHFLENLKLFVAGEGLRDRVI